LVGARRHRRTRDWNSYSTLGVIYRRLVTSEAQKVLSYALERTNQHP
jgi:hypothetical protein